MNQVQSQLCKKFGHRRRVVSLIVGAILGVIAVQLAGCDPSPASQALKTGSQTKAEIPPAGRPDAPQFIDGSAEGQVAAPQQTAESAPAPLSEPTPSTIPESDPDLREASDSANEEGLVLLGQVVPAGTSQRLMWSASEIFEGVSTATPVLVVNGSQPGPTLCLTAAIHGDELNGIEMVRRVLHELEPEKLSGAVIGIPIVNLQGFRRGSRYLPDRRDLNRFFPGNELGSSAARIAYSLFDEIIQHCDTLVDLHTGSFYRTNLPQLRADLRYTKIKELTQGFGSIAVLHSVAAPGTLRRAATDRGIPSVTLEAGEPMRLQSAKVDQGVNGVVNLLNALDMVHRVQLLGQPEPAFYESTWVRADHGGILFTVVRLGQKVATGDVLGTVTDPITNEQNLIYSPENGRILGMALNQVVMPGFAAFRIGIETDGSPTGPSALSLDWNENIQLAMPTTAKKEPETTGTTVANDTEEASE